MGAIIFSRTQNYQEDHQNLASFQEQNEQMKNQSEIPDKSPIDRYHKNNILWVDKNQCLEQQHYLSLNYHVIRKKTVEEAIDFLSQALLLSQISVICSGSMAKALLAELEEHKQIRNANHIFIFCGQVQLYQQLKKNEKIKCVVNSIPQLTQAIDKNISLLQLVNFRKFADKAQKSEQLKYSYFIAALIIPIINQAKREDLITKFSEKLQHYWSWIKVTHQFSYPREADPLSIIKMYTGDGIYGYINSLLKSKQLKFIQNGHIMISDLYWAINMYSNFEERSRIPNLLYRGGNLNPVQLENLGQYMNSDIEFLSFLSTSKKQGVAIDFAENTLFTIYIPKFFSSLESKDIKIRGGYVDIQQFRFRYFEQEEVLFNIKTVMTLMRMIRCQKCTFIELIYGLDQIICFLNQNKRQFDVHHYRPEKISKICKKCGPTGRHLIGTQSQTVVCLNNFQAHSQKLLKQSLILINQKYVVNGMVLYYDQLVQDNILKFSKQQKAENSHLCKKCKARVKCEGCVEWFCVCTLATHDKDHLDKYHILVEGEVPRFVSIQSRRNQFYMYQTNRQIEEKITCIADSLILSRDQIFMKQAQKLYDAQIQSQKFKKLEYQVQYHYYFNRGQSRRQKKYIGVKVTEQQFQLSLKDYQFCYSLVKDTSDQTYRKSKALLHIGIVLDDLKKFDEALQKYNQSMELLQNLEARKKDLSQEEKSTKMQILNCLGFLYMHLKQYQKAILYYRKALEGLKLLRQENKAEQAKFLNNLANCLNNIGNNQQEAFDVSKKSYQLRLNLFGSEYSLTKSSQINYNRARQALNKKQNS